MIENSNGMIPIDKIGNNMTRLKPGSNLNDMD